MTPLDPGALHSVLGDEAIGRFVGAFYGRVPADPILGPMYPETDIAGAEERLRDFLIYRFGGSASYIEKRGHPRLRRRHGPFEINELARDRWLELMGAALDECELEVRAEASLRSFFAQVADFLINAR